MELPYWTAVPVFKIAVLCIGYNVLKAAEMPLEEHKDSLPELEDSSFEAKIQVPLIPCRIDEAENSATEAVPYTTITWVCLCVTFGGNRKEGKKEMTVFLFFLQYHKLSLPSWKLLALLQWDFSRTQKP